MCNFSVLNMVQQDAIFAPGGIIFRKTAQSNYICDRQASLVTGVSYKLTCLQKSMKPVWRFSGYFLCHCPENRKKWPKNRIFPRFPISRLFLSSAEGLTCCLAGHLDCKPKHPKGRKRTEHTEDYSLTLWKTTKSAPPNRISLAKILPNSCQQERRDFQKWHAFRAFSTTTKDINLQ